jgi:hypothetical protein
MRQGGKCERPSLQTCKDECDTEETVMDELLATAITRKRKLTLTSSSYTFVGLRSAIIFNPIDNENQKTLY